MAKNIPPLRGYVQWVAIHREKQLKKYHRTWKEELIESTNPEWKDLSAEWYDPKEFELFKKFEK